MNRFDLIAQTVRISTLENVFAHSEASIRLRRAQQHRFQVGASEDLSPMRRARSGS